MTDQIENITNEYLIKDHELSYLTSIKIKVKSKKGYYKDITFWINKFVTGNCQMFSIEHFNAIIENYEKNDVKYILDYTFDVANKKFVLIDIKEHIYEEFLKMNILKEEYTLFNTPYISTNNSEMRIIGFHLNKINKNEENE